MNYGLRIADYALVEIILCVLVIPTRLGNILASFVFPRLMILM